MTKSVYSYKLWVSKPFSGFNSATR